MYILLLVFVCIFISLAARVSSSHPRIVGWESASCLALARWLDCFDLDGMFKMMGYYPIIIVNYTLTMLDNTDTLLNTSLHGTFLARFVKVFHFAKT